MAKYGNTPSFLALSCVGAMAFASGAHAQDNGQGQALGGVTVTDTAIDDSSIKVEKPESPKYVRPLLDTPQTITVIGNQTIQKQNLLTLRDVLSTVPGITFGAGEGGGGYGDSINLRGQSANTDISIDGVRDSAQYSRTDPFNLEQVEVTNGANSVFGGSGAIGGNINLVTKRPKTDSETLVQGGIGTSDYYRATIDSNVRVNEQIAVRLNAMYHENDVARRDVIRAGIMGQQRDHRGVQGREEGRDAVALSQKIARGIRHAHGEVGALVDDGAHARPHHRGEHLFAERDDAVLDDLEREDVVRHGCWPPGRRW